MKKMVFGAVFGAARAVFGTARAKIGAAILAVAAGFALGGCLARSDADFTAHEAMMATSTFKAQGLAVSASYITPFAAGDFGGADGENSNLSSTGGANSNLAGADDKNGADEGADFADDFDVFFVNLIPQNASIVSAKVNDVPAQIVEINGASSAGKNSAKMARNSVAQDLPRGFERFNFAPFKLDWARYFVVFVPSIEADTLKLHLVVGDETAPNSNLAKSGAKVANGANGLPRTANHARNGDKTAPNSNLATNAAATRAQNVTQKTTAPATSSPSVRGNNPTRSVSLDFAKVARYWRWSPAI